MLIPQRRSTRRDFDIRIASDAEESAAVIRCYALSFSLAAWLPSRHIKANPERGRL
jgi:hypothetical protein